MGTRLGISMLCVASLALAVTVQPAAAGQSAQDELRANKTSTEGKVHATLRELVRSPRESSPLARHLQGYSAADGTVAVNIVAAGGDGAALKRQLEALGLQHAVAFRGVVSGRAPLAALKAIAADTNVMSVRPSLAHTNAGLVTSQGDRAQYSDKARQRLGVDGRGVKVGVLSDSFDCLTGPIFSGQPYTSAADDIANGDLPATTTVLEETIGCGGSDEGRAMAQIVHDVAPGASIAFHSAFNGDADFAQGIIDLADAGASVIVDDVIYFGEPMFQDGIIAQAADAVKARGVAYFSSAGNQARQSYESRWRNSRSFGADGRRHNFATGEKQDGLQRITLMDGAYEYVILNWDQPAASAGGAGSQSDVDMLFYDTSGNLVPFCWDPSAPLVCQYPGWDNNIGGDPVEFAVIANFSGTPVDVNASIELYSGPTPGYLKYVWYDEGYDTIYPDEYDTASGTTYGHANAAGAESVAAAAWYNTNAWGLPFHPGCAPACTEYFSSAGGTPIFFDPQGNRLARKQVRTKPGITAPDGGNTTFFYSLYYPVVPGSTEPDNWPNFFGTSAAAPHAAGVAALMMDARARSHRAPYSPDAIYGILRKTALDISASAGRTIGPFPFANPEGFDYDSGYGLINAAAAVKQAAGD